MIPSKLDKRWDSIDSDPLRPCFTLYDAMHPLDFYIGKNTEKQKIFLLVTLTMPPLIRDMRAIQIRSFKRDDGKWSLLLTLQSDALGPMFSMLCEDLIESSRKTLLSADQSLAIVLARLSNWRKLLERGIPDLLSENEVRGLCGELLFLCRLIPYLGKSNAVAAWVGPKKSPQDFQLSDSAWEIKTIRPGGDTITISSEEQLQTTTRSIQLVVYELADGVEGVKNAFTLTSLVENIRSILIDDHHTSELFEQRLATANYVPRSEYTAIFLIENAVTLFSVDAGFPCISTSHLLPGVSHVSYNISLSFCEKFRVNSHFFINEKDAQ